MPLIPPRKGNPSWIKGVAQNPAGRPKGSTTRSREEKILDKLKKKERDPLDQLIRLADILEFQGKLEESADIWLKIQEYCEPKKKPVETAPEKPISPEQSKENVDDMLRLLEEASEENGQQNEGNAKEDLSQLQAGTPNKEISKE